MSVTASLVIQFGAAAGQATISAELDEDKNGGKTSFAEGDSVYFRVYADTAYTVTATSGSVSKTASNKSVTVEGEGVTLANEAEVDLSKPVISGLAVSWYGSGPAMAKKPGTTRTIRTDDGEPALAVGKADYTSRYDEWKLQAPASLPDEYAILILIAAGS